MALRTKLAAATSLAAAFSMLAATPADARERWGRWGHRDRVDAGDVIAGVLVLGTIAAIANSAKNNRERERTEGYPVPYPRDDERYRYRTPEGYGRNESRGMDRAADICAAEVERQAGRVGSVDGVNRNADGWQVSGELENGRAYSCWIGNDGRVSDVDVSDSAAYQDRADGQWSDEDYARAREAQEAVPAQPQDSSQDGGDDGRYTLSQAPDFSES